MVRNGKGLDIVLALFFLILWCTNQGIMRSSELSMKGVKATSVRRILFIDDCEDTNFLHNEYVKMVDNTLCVKAIKQGTKVIDYLKEAHVNGVFPNLIFVDINLPIMGGIEILLPPLREREDDIELLAQDFLKEFNLKYQKKELQFSSKTLEMLAKHPWPGNIRELQHTIERAVILSNGKEILETDLGFKTANSLTSATALSLPNNLNINDIEKLLVTKALEKHSGNITNTAKELGLTRAALYRRIEKFNL